MRDGGIHVTPSPRSFERRMDYLDHVGEHLRMPDDRRDDVLEEIAAHLDDAIDSLMDEGLSIEQAEREAMARLGSPEELGDNLRRTHQTTRRLLAAAGGGVWHGLEGAITGYIIAFVLALPVIYGLLVLTSVLDAVLPEVQLDTTPLFTSFMPAVACGALWLAGRWMVRAVAARSWRREHTVRRPIAAVGFVILAVLILVVPADYIWFSVLLTIAVPFAFAAGAMSAGGRDDGSPWVDVRWPARLPSKRKVLWGSVIGLVIVPMAVFASSSVVGMNETPVLVEPPAPPADPWVAGGYDAVATRRVEPDLWIQDSASPQDGWALMELPTDIVDWDAWPGLRVEAWRATSPFAADDQALVEPERGPYAVVPVDDPWGHPRVPIRVGQPGVNGYLVFLVAQDPVTGERTVIGQPDGWEAQFHGTLPEWFAAR